MKPMAIEPMAVARLRPSPRNARTHSGKQIRQIADSIKKFGFTNPVLIGDGDEIVAGHGRVEAAKLLGLECVPTLRLSGLDETARRAYGLADNKLALNAGWDRGALAVELRAVDRCALRRGGHRLLGRGHRSCPRRNASGQGAVRRKGSANSLPRERGEREPAAVTRSDDLWRLDRHCVLCTDPDDLTTIDRMLEGERVVFVAFEPALCDRIVHRFRQLTGQDATLAASGQSFAAVAQERIKHERIKKEPMR